MGVDWLTIAWPETDFSSKRESPPIGRRLSIIVAISIALLAALLAIVPMPIPAMGGVAHPRAVAEAFASLAFGPLFGTAASGVGAAIADLALGSGGFAPLSCSYARGSGRPGYPWARNSATEITPAICARLGAARQLGLQGVERFLPVMVDLPVIDAPRSARVWGSE